MTWALITVAGASLAWVAAVMAVRRRASNTRNRITPAAGRILFAFIGENISRPTLDAALRLARAENATLVPAYLATIPLNRSLTAPVPNQCERAMPLLETIEQHAARLNVPIDSRIETGRTPRHALRQLIDHEHFHRLVIPAASHSSEGFSSEDIAWVLEHASGEIVVLRPESSHAPPQYISATQT